MTFACGGDDATGQSSGSDTEGTTTGTTTVTSTTDVPVDDVPADVPEAPELDLYGLANGCYAVHADGDQWLTAAGENFAFADAEGNAARFFLKASDLGTYLLHDEAEFYVVAEDGPLLRQDTLMSDTLLIDDTYVSGAEWELQASTTDPTRYQFRHRRTEQWLGLNGLVDEANAVPFALEERDGCTAHPELSLDANGEITRTTFDDGDLYGIVDTHSHILSNFAFGGGGIFHGAPFHRLGVEHALPDCALYHGENGRKDFFGFAFDTTGADAVDLSNVITDLIAGELSEDNHLTAGYPDFTEWPDAPNRSTHQTQYYRWLERAWMSGLRLVVQHATTNSIICHLTAGEGVQETRYSCEDMVAVDRIIEETYAMERYIDAQNGGPGMGWFRIVFTPAEAREVVGEGKMAVILGIETSDLFDCRMLPREGSPICDEPYVIEQLDRYHDLGVRVLFPVHKYDNAFSAGDGDRAFIEVGNFFNSGQYSNFVEDCPDVPSVFDKGNVEFGALNQPRDDYFGDPPADMANFPNLPLGTALPHLSLIGADPLEGDYCQNHGLTPLGETLLTEMMARGMLIEVDHFSRRSYERAFEILEENDYPAVGTHGSNFEGRLYQLGGVSKTGLGRCQDPDQPGAMTQRLKDRVALIEQNGGYPAEGFGFDLNGFAGAPGPRFGPDGCADPQDNRINYPFDSVAGDTTFTQPRLANRNVDFNTEGLVHIGLLPELIEDARRDAVAEEDLEPLFRSAEGYIRMWERAEQRSTALGGG